MYHFGGTECISYKDKKIQQLFKLIRHIRETAVSKPKLLRGICKSQSSLDTVEDEDDASGHEEGEEEDEGFSDDDCVDLSPGTGSSKDAGPKMIPPKQASNDSAATVLPTPCRRFSRKGSMDEDEVQIISTGKSRDRLELEAMLKKIAALELSRWGPFHFILLLASLISSSLGTIINRIKVKSRVLNFGNLETRLLSKTYKYNCFSVPKVNP